MWSHAAAVPRPLWHVRSSVLRPVGRRRWLPLLLESVLVEDRVQQLAEANAHHRPGQPPQKALLLP